MKYGFYIFYIFFILHSSLFIPQVEAQSFSSLWKQVKTAESKDQPRSALTAIEKIEHKAEKQQSYGNLLAALMKELAMQNELSPDSLDAARERLRNRQALWRNEGKGVEAALAEVACNNGRDVNATFIDSLMMSPDSALYRKAEKAHEYLPLIVKGDDSRYFNNDLLSLIIMTCDRGNETTDLLEKYYGKDNKVVQWRRLVDAIVLEHDAGKCISMIDKALVEWSDWKEINFLKNQRQDITRPMYNAIIDDNIVSSESDVKVIFKGVRNINHVIVSLVNIKGEKRSFTHAFNLKNEWEKKETDTLNIGKLPLGKWMVSIVDDKREIKRAADTLYVTNLKAIELGLPKDKTRVVVVDATTGEPVSGATVHYKGIRPEAPEQQAVTDANGETILGSDSEGRRNYRYYIRVTKGDDTAMPEANVWTSYFVGKSKVQQSYLDLFTDRAIYRRGQTIHATVICHTIFDGKEAKVEPSEKVALTMTDSQGKEIQKKTVVTDDFGTATTDFLIPEEGINGYYHITAKTVVARTASFRVEDYKRPTYTVELTTPNNDAKEHLTYHSGDTAVVIGVAKTYSGVPVANAKVVYSVKRNNSWWIGRNMDAEVITDDTLYTDPDGRFYVKVPMQLPEDADTTWYYCYRYNVHTTVTDNSGETQASSITLLLKNNRPLKPQEPENPKMLSASTESFSEDNSPVVITLRDTRQPKSKDVITAFYTICSGNNVIESSRMEFTDSTTYSLTYKEEYGDGVNFVVAWVKNGTLYNSNVHIKKYLPSKKLTMEWGTFRNKLYPGQSETWTLKVKNPNGTPSKAQVMAVMYDKSLDALTSFKWNIADRRVLYTPSTTWNTGNVGAAVFYGYKAINMLKEHRLVFNHIDDEYMFTGSRFYRAFNVKGHGKGVLRSAPMMAMAKVDSSSEPIGSFNVAGNEANALYDVVTVGYAAEEDRDVEPVVPMRSDFSETAFFLPHVMTDNNGVATLQFTMPESVTSWRFMAIAHDKEMRTALMDTTALTQKKVMVQAKMPRFLHIGDKATISASIANMMEKTQKVTVNFIVKDAKTEKLLHRESKVVLTESGRTAGVTFAYEVKNSDDLICCFTAQVPGFSDGEQHLLPILAESIAVPADTMPITVRPKEMMMETLPAMQVPKSNNAITLAHAYYANTIVAHIKDTIPSAANDNVLVQLLNLQSADGGFAWYHGMQSSRYITIEVLKTLARLNIMCGKQSRTEYMMDRAFAYAKAEMEQYMRDMKKYNVKYLSSTALDWLYTLAISGKDGGAAETFFRKMIYEETKHDDMQTKAVAAITLNENGKEKKAREFAESIKQHTVYRADMGRYFDSYRALYSWCDYRIPTHTMCIEALENVTPDDGQTISEMLRWLVSAKRTQRWDNPINTVNAVYALYSSNDTTITADYVVSPEDLKGALKVSRRVSGTMKVGNKVKVILTIEADRDYDFVTVTDNRAACLEPVNQLSGYRWGAYRGYYAEMRDTQSVFHFDQLAKGKYEIETEYYIDRTGEYLSGNATVVCEYAPEFRGSAEAIQLNVK